MKMLSNRTGGFLPALILAVMLVLGLSAQKAQAQDNYDDYGNGNYQEFYDDLSPYGQWMYDPQYGYVWAPNNVGNDFRPYYTNGQWAMTEYGNTWVSNYDWGWATFHYGRWAQGSYGWMWIPGNTWGPAWVNWRQGGGYYGWAPMGPGISINISFGGGYNVPNPWWTFIPCGNIYTPGWQRYYSPRRTVNIINNTTIINNTYVDNRSRNTYVTGPRRNEIEAATRQRVNVYNVSNRTRSGATNISGRTVNVYRPAIQRTSGRGQVTAAPRQVKTLERSAITNTGGGRAPSRSAIAPPPQQQGNNRIERSTPSREVRPGQQAARPEVQQRAQQQQVERDRTQQQRAQQVELQRNTQLQRDQQVQQQRVQRDQVQRDQQVQQQRVQRDQVQQQRNQQVEQQRAQRDQMQQQQRVQQAEQQRNSQMQQQRAQQEQQMQQRQQMQQQRIERQQSQPQRVERSAPAPQPQRVERSAPAPQERSVERAPRGR